MTNYHVQYSAEAVEDLRNIYQYIAVELQAPQAAQGQVDDPQNDSIVMPYTNPFCGSGMGTVGIHGNAESTGEQLPGVLSRGKRGFDRDRCPYFLWWTEC